MLAAILAFSVIQPPAINPNQLLVDVMKSEQRATDALRRGQELRQWAADLNRESDETSKDIQRLLKDSNEKLDKIEKMLEEKKKSKQK